HQPEQHSTEDRHMGQQAGFERGVGDRQPSQVTHDEQRGQERCQRRRQSNAVVRFREGGQRSGQHERDGREKASPEADRHKVHGNTIRGRPAKGNSTGAPQARAYGLADNHGLLVPRAPPLSMSISFPESLPVSAKRDEIAAAIAANQVVIVCGETGSGKTTQLPKIALSMGRGKLNYPARQARLIGHTQPRRIAASSVAKRIAQELNTTLGDAVGFKVRFQDRLSRDASVKLMTDGILLAETQTDPLLKAYDTIILDEAHERSLNIDFLLGYLRQILPRRPDLKIVVTSATIDADRFARHFGSAAGPAPVIYVSGRMYPVEQRWRAFEEARDYGLNEAIADAVDELWRGPAGPASGGDILVFLPGEREIREAADHLRKHLAQQPVTRNAEVLPLFARLSQAEQERIFDSHSARRIVLATNV